MASIVTCIEEVSHRLRSPLSVMLGVLSDLCEGYQLTKEELQEGREAARTMVRLLDSLVEVVHRSGKSMPNCSDSDEIEASRVLEELIEIVRN